ncbi:MAG: 1,4-beta-xylanase [Bacteroidetes bacterium]|nr:MAG: 1,4-beta-xylanase [Bacteroidota bacterium]
MNRYILKISITTLLVLGLFTVFSNQKLIDKKLPSSLKTTVGQRWSVEKANAWYSKHDWIVGCNYVHSNAINQLKMWQKETFSPAMIDKELGWAEEIGFNSMRVFLHYLPWKEDAEGFYERLDQFLEICDQHHIAVMLIFFDDVWNPNPRSGLQPQPKKGIHNSGWVQCPGKNILENLDLYKSDLKKYVQQTLKRYANDSRVLIWDLYNEPGNSNMSSYGKIEFRGKKKQSLILLKNVFSWAREIDLSQPISSGIWNAGHAKIEKLNAFDQFCYKNSDILNFHAYMGKTQTKKLIKVLKTNNRPLICTEYMARTAGSTFEEILPLLKKYNVGAYNWGFVAGKSNTIYPWESWKEPFKNEPEIWFHDILRQDGTPFSKDELQFIKKTIQD